MRLYATKYRSLMVHKGIDQRGVKVVAQPIHTSAMGRSLCRWQNSAHDDNHDRCNALSLSRVT